MEQNTNTLPATYQQPAPAAPAPVPAPPASYFASLSSFEAVQRMAGLLAASDMVPTQYQKSVANCVLALEVAMQTRCSPFFVMQNLNIIQGRPSWGSQIIAAMLSTCGRFRGGLHYEMDNPDNPTTCRIWTIDAATGERLNGPTVSLKMAREEGWTERRGSKWKTMPEVMLGHRAVAFFARRFAPDLLLGMRTDDEIRDMGADEPPAAASKARAIDALIEAKEPPAAASKAQAIDALIEAQEKKRADLVAATATAAAAKAEPPEPEPTPEESSSVAETEAAQETMAALAREALQPEPEPEKNLPPQLAKYLKAKGEKPRPAPPPQPAPEQASLVPETPPSAEPPDAAARTAAMLRYIKELDDKEGLSELRWWKERNEERLLKDLGADSEELQAVIEHWMEKVAALEKRLMKK